jgi:hypothetical protein
MTKHSHGIAWAPLDGTGACCARLGDYEMRVEPDGDVWEYRVGDTGRASGFGQQHSGAASTMSAAKRFAVVVAEQCIREDERREARGDR